MERRCTYKKIFCTIQAYTESFRKFLKRPIGEELVARCTEESKGREAVSSFFCWLFEFWKSGETREGNLLERTAMGGIYANNTREIVFARTQ